MSSSLRDQLLKAGLINKKQANEAERQQQRHERHPPKHNAGAASGQSGSGGAAPQRTGIAQAAKAARDQALNRQQREKAEKKARLAQIKQLIDQNQLPVPDGGESYNFIDGTKIRRIAVTAPIRRQISRGEVVILRHEARYHLIPVAAATRIRERDDRVFIICAASESAAPEDMYREFSVPDDLMW